MGKMTSFNASRVKRLGHAEEETFNAFFGDKHQRDRNFSGSSEDNIVTSPEYKKIISKKLGPIKSYKVSLKSGNTWQFHLGRIDELSKLDKLKIRRGNPTIVIHSKSFLSQQRVLKSKNFWEKYLSKGDLLCYNDKKKMYTFFKMKNVVAFIIKNAKWSILPTGRIKGSLIGGGKTYSVLTFEYRKDKHQFVLGAFGGKNGLRLFTILKENLNHCEIHFESELKSENSLHISKRSVTKTSKGKIGEIRFDNNYIYICTGNRIWRRIKFSKW
jgi:hypothetical protein